MDKPKSTARVASNFPRHSAPLEEGLMIIDELIELLTPYAGKDVSVCMAIFSTDTLDLVDVEIGGVNVTIVSGKGPRAVRLIQ